MSNLSLVLAEQTSQEVASAYLILGSIVDTAQAADDPRHHCMSSCVSRSNYPAAYGIPIRSPA